MGSTRSGYLSYADRSDRTSADRTAAATPSRAAAEMLIPSWRARSASSSSSVKVVRVDAIPRCYHHVLRPMSAAGGAPGDCRPPVGTKVPTAELRDKHGVRPRLAPLRVTPSCIIQLDKRSAAWCSGNQVGLYCPLGPVRKVDEPINGVGSSTCLHPHLFRPAPGGSRLSLAPCSAGEHDDSRAEHDEADGQAQEDRRSVDRRPAGRRGPLGVDDRREVDVLGR